MAKVELKQLNVDNEVFKRIKKYKRTIYTIQNKESEFQKKQKIIIVNDENNKKLKRKIVKVYPQDNLVELKTFLKRKEKYLYPKTFEDNVKLTAIEFKYNKKIFRKILLGILILVLLFFSCRFISNKIEDIKARKFYNNINKLAKNRTDYVFVEINPSFVLTIKDNKVNDVACLNDDCISIYNDIDIKGKNINDSIDTLYNISEEKGFDISKGVKVKVSNNINIENKDYITIEYIDITKEKELLREVINNEEIKNVSNDNYYTNLWNELKKDDDYGKVYSCNINNNKELECYIKKDFVIAEKDLLEILKRGSMADAIANYPKVIPRLEKIEHVLKKFKFNVSTEITDLFTSPAAIINVRGNDFSYVTGGTAKDVYYTGRIHCNFYMFYLTDINLLKPDNIPLILDNDEDDYRNNNEDHTFTRTIIDEDNQIEEVHDRYCNEIICYKSYEHRELHCELQEDGHYNWESKETKTFQKCELGYKNCIYISENEYYWPK